MAVQLAVKGDIVDDQTAQMYEFFNMPCCNPQAITDALAQANGQDIELQIASNGGDVFAGSEIYTALKAYTGQVTCQVVGLAASAASIIAMAGDKVQMSPVAQLMIHQAWTDNEGNSDSMNHTADVLNSLDGSIVNAYMLKTGLDQNTIIKMMSDETWMSAQAAVDKGFADEIMFVDATQPVVMNSLSSIPSKQIVNDFLNFMAKKKSADSSGQKIKNEKENKKALLQRKLGLLF